MNRTMVGQLTALGVAALVVASCAGAGTPHGFTKPGTSREAARQDEAQCRFEAARGGGVTWDPNPFISAMNRTQQEQRVLQLCMEARGYIFGMLTSKDQ